jgi:hypothetical protein
MADGMARIARSTLLALRCKAQDVAEFTRKQAGGGMDAREQTA